MQMNLNHGMLAVAIIHPCLSVFICGSLIHLWFPNYGSLTYLNYSTSYAQ